MGYQSGVRPSSGAATVKAERGPKNWIVEAPSWLAAPEDRRAPPSWHLAYICSIILSPNWELLISVARFLGRSLNGLPVRSAPVLGRSNGESGKRPEKLDSGSTIVACCA